MPRINAHSRSTFVVLWTLACLWLPLLLTVGWHTPAPTTSKSLYSGLNVALLSIIALSQWFLLADRVRESWLWMVLGLAAVAIEWLISGVLFNLVLVLFSPDGNNLYSLARALALGLAVASTQAVAMRHWRLGGKSWAVLCFASFLGGYFLKTLVGDYLVSALVDVNSRIMELAQSILWQLLQWGVFGAITGWHMWRRLNG